MNAATTTPRTFRDRREAGVLLAALLAPLAGEDPIVLGLPRGGVPVAFEVARALGAPLDVLLVRKVGAPGNPELGLGAVAEGGIRILDDRLVRALLVSHDELEWSLGRARAELSERAARYRPEGLSLPLAGRTVIVVDDGLATGGTAAAAVQAVRARGAARVVLGVPVAARESLERLRSLADEVYCVQVPEPMYGVGAWYEEFGQTSDQEVLRLLRRAHAAPGTDDPPVDDPPSGAVAASGPVRIPVAGGVLSADLVVPAGAHGLVIFAHGSGSSRHSSRNRHVAEELQRHGLATLLLDLLTEEEELDRRNVFDIDLLATRLVAATVWAAGDPRTAPLPVGYFGASTGGGAALVAAARPDADVQAVVSRGGRPDLAAAALPNVRVPVLLIVGGADEVVLELNREAAARLKASCELAVVPGATHLFEEPGALDEVARLAAGFLDAQLVGRR